MKKKICSLINPDSISYLDLAVIGLIIIGFWLFFIHPDIMETSNHSYLFLESVISGNVRSFYKTVELHDNALYYMNGAYYNIFVYAVFALWQLPVSLVEQLFSLSMNETFYFIWSKALCAILYCMCAVLVYKICLSLKIAEKRAAFAAFAFLLNPVAFFSPMIMGQYDSLCLFLMLASFFYFAKGDLLRFSVIAGIAILCKYFAFFIFLPLLLLMEKRVVNLMKFLLCASFPLILTSILLPSANSPHFGEMIVRMLLPRAGLIPLFPALFLLVCVWSYLKKPDNMSPQHGLHLSFVVFALLFLLIESHPQWYILLIPFLIITVFSQRNLQLFFYLGALLSVFFFIHIFIVFPGHFELNLLGFGILRLFHVPNITGREYVRVLQHFNFSESFKLISEAAFRTVLFVITVVYLPFNKGVSLADKGHFVNPKSAKRAIWFVFIFGTGFWLLAIIPGLFLPV